MRDRRLPQLHQWGARYRNQTRRTSNPALLRRRRGNPTRTTGNLPLPAHPPPNTLKNHGNRPLSGQILVRGSQMWVTTVTRMVRQHPQIIWKIVLNGGSPMWVTNDLPADFPCEARSTNFAFEFPLMFVRRFAIGRALPTIGPVWVQLDEGDNRRRHWRARWAGVKCRNR